MKIRAIVISALILCCISAAIVYTKAAQPKNESKMITEALQGNNTPQLIKALIGKMKDKMEVNTDDFPTLIKDVETYAKACPDTAAVAVLHSMIAEMYNFYYTQEQWKINRRTDLVGYVPDDIREWTANLFTQKVKEELALSLQPAQLLQQTPVSEFNAILETGKDTPALRPTLYDFLAFRALSIAPSAELYEELIAYLNTQADKESAVLTNLEYLNFKYNRLYEETERKKYTAALDSLLKIYGDKPYSVEIIVAKLNIQSYRLNQNKANDDSIRTAEYTICKETIARFPNYDRIGLLKNRLADMQAPNLLVNTSNTVYPGKELALKLNYRNVPKVEVLIYKSLRTPQQTFGYNNENGKYLGALVKKVTFSLTMPNTYTPMDTTLVVPMENMGLYECVVSAPASGMKAYNLVNVSRLASALRNMSDGSTEVLVTDYLSGKPVSDASVIYYSGRYNNLQKQNTVKTDKDGLAVFPKKGDVMAFQVTLPGDASPMLTTTYPYINKNTEIRKARPQLSLFTDRGLYRPGQTIYFKGIAYINQTDNPYAVEGETFKVTLRDANWKEVATKTFKTNKFGSFNGEFTLPQQTLNGSFTLNSEYGNMTVRVEEYKRPSFFVELQPVKGEITFGDRVTITGKAQTFSGVALQSGDITYRIVEHPNWPRFFYASGSNEQVAEGKTTVGNDGSFSITFQPEKSKNLDSFFPYQRYEVIATLTDSNGETQEASSFFAVGESSIMLSTNIRSQFDKESANVSVEAMTLNGEKIKVEGSYIIKKLIDENQPSSSRQPAYKEGEQVAAGKFTSGQVMDKKIFSELTSGRYRIILEANDSKGRPAKTQEDFILYSPHDKRPPVFTHTWMLEEKTSCLPGEEAKILFGTSDKEAHVLYELYQDGKCISRERLVLNDENHLFRIPFKESYKEGIVVSFTFVKEGQLYTTQSRIRRQEPDRRLTIKPVTFRDRLLPGNRETWKFNILDADSLPVMAEMLASMYDASLDKILPFKWAFNPNRAFYLSAPSFQAGVAMGDNSSYQSGKVKRTNVPDYQYDRLNWQGMLDRRRYRAYGNGMMMKSAASRSVAQAEVLNIVEDSASSTDEVEESGEPIPANLAENAVESTAEGVADSAIEELKPLQIRENFNETAFFYPSLQTNEEGDVIVQFTLPESNTTWKFQALANTADMKYGSITREVISSKPLMVLPNLPRFMRQGDEVTISTQVINNSKEAISGRVSLELFNLENNQPVICLTKSQKSFDLEADSITTATWTFRVPATTNLMGCRIVADSGSGSDGEQHLVPVLSDNILVTESKPFYLMDEKEARIKLSGSLTPFRTTLEMTANPIWYAIQALPTITQPQNDNVISWFASYYANTLAGHIATANPRIQQMVKQWTAQGGTAETLYSNLEKNQELKNILLQETPWVLAADNETEQKQRLSLLFDTNRAQQQRELALQRLVDLQNEEGGWSWFKGFFPSRQITLFILNGMTQLVEMNAIQYGEQEKVMQMKALKYLDKQIKSDYDYLIKTDKKWQNSEPTDIQLEYLFVRSAYRDIPELGDAREAIRFYTAQAEKTWSKQSLSGKGETAILMYRNGKKEVANSILAWLRRTATTSPEQGMYWANNRRGSSYFTSPLDTHCLLMKVFATLSPNQKETDRMKQWLLNQKRTQNWESTISTLNAIYSLVLTGGDWLKENNTCLVDWNGKTYSTAEGETGTGYLKVVLPEEKIVSSAGNTISIRKEGNTPAWGAVYEQYFENINKITKQKGVLNVEKKLFIERNSGSGLQIEPVTEKRPLRIGDKVIVRLTIRTDRTMDYVYLKDLRAGCFEPANQLSGMQFADGVSYYQSPTDVSENFFFSTLPEGTFVVEYPVYVTRSGEYAGGISTIQCLYAPEFVSHTEGMNLTVN